MLALEAECQRSPGNAEAWRLLGTVQAENDDDQQAIAAMNSSRPLLMLSVSSRKGLTSANTYSPAE